MMIRILPEASRDLELGGDFYESQRPGLGRYFNDSMMADIASLCLYAGIHQKDHGLYRMLGKRFPFAIYYDVREGIIEIYAVLDCRQDPSRISDRLG